MHPNYLLNFLRKNCKASLFPDLFQICVSNFMRNISVLKDFEKPNPVWSNGCIFGGVCGECNRFSCVTLFTPLCSVLPPEFGGVPMSGACCHLLLITRCSCISKSPFRSRERGRAVNWALWERRGVWSWGQTGWIFVTCSILIYWWCEKNELLITCEKVYFRI